ncbi:protein MNN4-like [Arachis stenosperma]|uniref:protein MNN4-like n=1 Tax=Arachis stenosperma TaxID=217475 RepID=UPI0025AD9C69|nr:protein MNN4-like [Arachis stenosperma]
MGQNEENQEDQQQEQPQYVHNQSSGQNEIYATNITRHSKDLQLGDIDRKDDEAPRDNDGETHEKSRDGKTRSRSSTEGSSHNNQNQEAAIRNLERHMEQMAKQNTEMGEKQSNASPSTTSDHPRDKGKATKWEECKAIMVGSEKEAINQEEHNRKVPREETEEKSEEERKTKNAKSSKKDEDILETQLQEKKEG